MATLLTLIAERAGFAYLATPQAEQQAPSP